MVANRLKPVFDEKPALLRLAGLNVCVDWINLHTGPYGKRLEGLSISPDIPAIGGQDVRRRRNLVHGWTNTPLASSLMHLTRRYLVLLTTVHRFGMEVYPVHADI